MRSRSALLLAAALLLVHAAAARAQSINGDIISSEKPLSTEQKQTVTDWVNGRVEKMVNGQSDQEKRRAREDLVNYEPARAPGAKPPFQSVYSEVVDKAIGNALSSKDALTRMNGMIIVANLPNPAVDHIVMATTDESPAVRYWAGAAVRLVQNRTGAPPLPDADQKKILAAFAKAARNPGESLVLQALLVGIANLTIPEAFPELFKVLDERVVIHARNPNLPFFPEHDALNTVLSRIVVMFVNKPLPPETMNAMLKVSVKYMDLISLRLAGQGIGDPQVLADAVAMLRRAESAARYVVDKLYPAAQVPAPLTPMIESTPPNWGNLRLAVQDWKRMLTDPNGLIKFNPNDVTAPQNIATQPATRAAR